MTPSLTECRPFHCVPALRPGPNESLYLCGETPPPDNPLVFPVQPEYTPNSRECRRGRAVAFGQISDAWLDVATVLQKQGCERRKDVLGASSALSGWPSSAHSVLPPFEFT